MLFKAPTGKVHSSLVDHDRCVFIRNNAKTDYSALAELPVHEYEAGDDCMNCESAIEAEVGSVEASDTPVLFSQDGTPEVDGKDIEEDDDWEDEDDFVADPEKKEKAERDLGIRDADTAIEQWELLAERTQSDKGRLFWEAKIADLKSRIEFVPESDKPEAPGVSEEETPAVEPEETKPVRRTTKKSAPASVK
ncbi:hypothetical protein [Streptomyces crystallinus]|uniref:Uncharacterized protein n=1 Tax=Streptomyces crystallinus TaxID=68191 RepID=A0ABP3Q476_9ACTN